MTVRVGGVTKSERDWKTFGVRRHDVAFPAHWQEQNRCELRDALRFFTVQPKRGHVPAVQIVKPHPLLISHRVGVINFDH